MNNISVLIPTYKRPKLLIEAIQSCMNQTHQPFEIIVGDDSPDNLTEIEIEGFIKTTKTSIIYFHNSPSLRQAQNINMLFEAAKGDKVILLHDDDLLLENAIESLLNCFYADPEIQITYGKQLIVSEDGIIDYSASERLNNYYHRSAFTEGVVLTPLEAGFLQQFPNDGYMMNIEVARSLKYRNYSEIGFIGDGCEYDFGLRIGQHGFKTYFTNVYTAKYRLSKSSMSTTSASNFTYYAFLILRNTIVPQEMIQKKNKKLRDIAPVAISQAISSKADKGHSNAVRIYFSKYHRSKILSPGGMKRLLMILFPGYF